MSKTIIEIENIQSGQPRAYADSIYEANISIFNMGILNDGSGFYNSPALPGGDWRVTRKHLDPPALGRVSMDDERLWIVYKMHGSHYVALRAFRSEQRANDWASSLQREQTCVEELEYDPRQGSDCNG